MEQELKKETSIISNNETSRYIMKKVYLDANGTFFWQKQRTCSKMVG
jgi:hypothetical protein